MVDVLTDINVLENAIIAFQEGASDEKRAAINALEKLLSQKQQLVVEFEQFCDK
jgi:hypothetical protein